MATCGLADCVTDAVEDRDGVCVGGGVGEDVMVPDAVRVGGGRVGLVDGDIDVVFVLDWDRVRERDAEREGVLYSEADGVREEEMVREADCDLVMDWVVVAETETVRAGVCEPVTDAVPDLVGVRDDVMVDVMVGAGVTEDDTVELLVRVTEPELDRETLRVGAGVIDGVVVRLLERLCVRDGDKETLRVGSGVTVRVVEEVRV